MSLHGLTIMVTRPKPQGEVLCDNIRAEGGDAIYFPTIEIIAPEDAHRFNHDMAKLDQCDMILFMSPQAVFKSAETIYALWPVFPAHLKVVALGQSTAEALTKAKIPVYTCPENDWSSEGLLDLPLLQNVQGKKIAVIRGETGREVIEEILTKRGAQINNVIAYRRVMPKIDVRPYKDLLHAHKIDIIICTSNEILQNLTTLLGVQPVPLLVISERMLCFAKNLGFEHLFLAKNASHNAIISELAKQKDQLCQMKRIRT